MTAELGVKSVKLFAALRHKSRRNRSVSSTVAGPAAHSAVVQIGHVPPHDGDDERFKVVGVFTECFQRELARKRHEV